MIKNYINRLNLSQIYYKLRDLNPLNSGKKFKELLKDGYCVLDEVISIETVNKFKKKYVDYSNFNFINNRKKINFEDLKNIFNDLKSLGALDLIKQYLGNNIYCYDNSVLTLGNEKSKDGSWQPHHDSKGRRIKIYIWLNKKNYDTHPLFYLKSSNKKITFWKNYNQTRYLDIDDNTMSKIYGDLGKIIIFDTHGIHSNFKTTTIPRSVIELTFEASGHINRINDKFEKGLKEISRLGAERMDNLL